MTRIAINLLPAEFTAEEVKRAKFYKVQLVGISVILFMVFLSSLTVALRILQSQNIKQVQTQLTQAENRVLNYKDRQASLFLLKNRLTTINDFMSEPSKQSATLALLEQLTPSSAAISSFSIDRNGDAVLSIIATDASSIDTLVSNLISPELNGGLISKVSVENLNKSRDGAYRVNLKVE